MVAVGFYRTITFGENVIVFSAGGGCFFSDNYIRELRLNQIDTVVNTADDRGFSSNRDLVEAGMEEVPIVFMAECLTPLPSQLDRWLSVLREQSPRGALRVAVHGMINGPLLVAVALRELGATMEGTLKMIGEAGGRLYTEQEHFLSSYRLRGLRRRSRWAHFCRGQVAKFCCTF